MGKSIGTDRQTMRIFWRAGLNYKPLLLRSLLFPAGVLLSGALAPLFISKTLGALALPHGNPLQYLWLFAATSLLGLTLNRIGHPAYMRYQAKVAKDLQLYAKLWVHQSGGFIEE